MRQAVFALLFVLLSLHSAFAESYCMYTNEQGVKRKVRSLRQIPVSLRSGAACTADVRPSAGQAISMAKPQEIDLEGSLRKQTINSAVGTIHLRWPRTAEEVLGRNPMRAMADAGRMVSKALKREGFPSGYAELHLDWNVVFMDENVPVDQVPMHLITNCHPAWMTPPANIYVVVQRVAAGCGGGHAVSASRVEAEMAEVLAHEMGHALEAHILGGNAFGSERWRAEGFATFFERITSEYSTVIPSGSVRREHIQLAQQSFQQSPDRFTFRGTGADYARASMYLEAVVNERGMKGLMRVYDRLKGGERSMMQAIMSETHWSRSLIEEKARSLVQ